MAGGDLDLGAALELHPQVALRLESFGALAYHYGNRRLVFLKSPLLVELVEALGTYPSAQAALADRVSNEDRPAYAAALSRLVRSEVLRAR